MSCKQALCPDEILSSYYLNLNARSFVKWLGLRSPNRNKFSRVASTTEKSIQACFALGGTSCFFFSLHADTLFDSTDLFFSLNVWKLHLSANNISSIRNSETKRLDAWKQLYLYKKFFKKTMQAILLLVWILIKIQMPRNSTTIPSF